MHPPVNGREATGSCSFQCDRLNLILYGGVGNNKTRMEIAREGAASRG